MKRLIGVFIVGLVLSNFIYAGADIKVPQPYKGGNPFGRLKDLAGAWEGVKKSGEKEEKIASEFTVNEKDSTITENLSFGDAHSTIHYDKKGNLKMTGYWAKDNQPGLILVTDDYDKLQYMLPHGDKVSAADVHLHSVVINITDKNHIVERWEFYRGDDPVLTTKIILTRVKKRPENEHNIKL